jgi:predicted RNA-binding protein with PIN domain
VRWVIDGNNVFGSRPDGWWNDRSGAARRLAQRVAEWSRTHDDPVTLVFDAPVDGATLELAGGNLMIEQATRRGRNAADDRIVEIVDEMPADDDQLATVVTSDGGLRRRLEGRARLIGAGRFLELLDGGRWRET